MSVTVEQQNEQTISDCSSDSYWRPTSKHKLEKIEKKIFQALTVPYEGKFVKINETDEIWTIYVNPSKSIKTPLVLMHGFGAGVGFWVLNLVALSKQRPVYAFDTIGFARSSRPTIPLGKDEAEEAFVNSIEGWRKAMNIEKMILMGHSFGGYLAFAYGLRHPDRLKHLILADPWGFPVPDEDIKATVSQRPLWVKVIAMVAMSFNPLASVRAAGPFGPSLVKKTRSDIGKKFSDLFDDDRIMDYIYHCNAQSPASGESAFKSMSSFFGWAANPMINRATLLASHVSLDTIYGSESWMDQSMGIEMKIRRPTSKVDGHLINGAGHHVYADKYKSFNNTVNRICDQID